MLLEVLDFQEKVFNSVYISSYAALSTISQSEKKINIYFIVKKKQKNKTFFLYLMVILVFDAFPLLLRAKKKKNKKHNFIGLKLAINVYALSRFVSIYLPILDVAPVINTRIFGAAVSWTWNSYPIIYEVDKLCEVNSNYVDYFQDYKLVFQSKVLRNNGVASSMIFRFFRLPLQIS